MASSTYRLAAASVSLAPVVCVRSVEIFRRGRFDAAITLHDGRRFGVVRQGLGADGRRSLYDRLRTIAESTTTHVVPKRF